MDSNNIEMNSAYENKNKLQNKNCAKKSCALLLGKDFELQIELYHSRLVIFCPSSINGAV